MCSRAEGRAALDMRTRAIESFVDLCNAQDCSRPELPPITLTPGDGVGDALRRSYQSTLFEKLPSPFYELLSRLR